MRNHLLSFGLSALVFSSSIQASAYITAPDDKVIVQLNSSSKMAPDLRFSLLVWNVHKGDQKESWHQDLSSLSQGKSFTLIQEGMDDAYMPQVLATLAGWGWWMARSFFYADDWKESTGVITGAVQDPETAHFLRTRDTEPVVGTPKVTLLTTYRLHDGSSVLVANLHGINFTTLAPFQRQIDDLIQVLQQWPGKIILGGDFNTWNSSRMDYLNRRTRENGLSPVTYKEDPRRLKLDHIFLRGCTYQNSKVHAEVETSDHAPLTADLDCGPTLQFLARD